MTIDFIKNNWIGGLIGAGIVYLKPTLVMPLFHPGCGPENICGGTTTFYLVVGGAYIVGAYIQSKMR